MIIKLGFQPQALVVKGYIKITCDGYGILTKSKSWLFAELVHQFPNGILRYFGRFPITWNFTIIVYSRLKNKNSTHMRGYSKKTQNQKVTRFPIMLEISKSNHMSKRLNPRSLEVKS
jgi:hypothetical protein